MKNKIPYPLLLSLMLIISTWSLYGVVYHKDKLIYKYLASQSKSNESLMIANKYHTISERPIYNDLRIWNSTLYIPIKGRDIIFEWSNYYDIIVYDLKNNKQIKVIKIHKANIYE